MTNQSVNNVNFSFWVSQKQAEGFDDKCKQAKIKRSMALRLLVEALNDGEIRLSGAGVDGGQNDNK